MTNENLEKCLLAKAILEKEYAYHYTYAQLARRVNTNEKILKAGIKLLTKQPVYGFLTSVRMEKGKQLLEDTDYSIEEIAARLGLDRSNFIKRFKKHTAFTPKEWRNNNRDTNTRYAV
jgi:AraC-like DNA-binding protein